MRIGRRAFVAGLSAVAVTGCDSAAPDSEPPADPTQPDGERAFADDISGTFGRVIKLPALDRVLAEIDAAGGALYLPEGRLYLVRYPAASLDAAGDAYAPEVVTGMELGLVALYQKCTHLGCRVPDRAASQLFECPCHDSKFTRVGEWFEGPAPRGLDRFAVAEVDGLVDVDTTVVIEGPAQDVTTVEKVAAGPHCIG